LPQEATFPQKGNGAEPRPRCGGSPSTPQGFLGCRGEARRGDRGAAPGQRRAARHDLGTRAGRNELSRVRAGSGRVGRGMWSSTRTGRPRKADDLRVLGARGLHLADRRTGPTTALAAAGHRRPAGQPAGTRSPPTPVEQVLARLRDEGPLTATQLGGAKAGGAVVGLVGGEDRRRVAARHGAVRSACGASAGGASTTCRKRVIPKDLIDHEADRRAVPVLPWSGRSPGRLAWLTHADFIEYQRPQRVRAAPAGTAQRSTDAAEGGRARSPVTVPPARAAGFPGIAVPGLVPGPRPAWG